MRPLPSKDTATGSSISGSASTSSSVVALGQQEQTLLLLRRQPHDRRARQQIRAFGRIAAAGCLGTAGRRARWRGLDGRRRLRQRCQCRQRRDHAN